ncbi:MAG: histidine phosphatase family protein [Alphaproteobacteria bacterium]
MQIAFIRHGPTAWNIEGRIQGHTDVPLSDAGRAAVARWRLPAELTGWRFVASPLSRARETALLLGAGADCPTDPRLMEANFGAWEGELLDALREQLGAAMQEQEARGMDMQPPGGESPRAMRERLRAFLAEHYRQDDRLIAVAHVGILRAAYSLATGWDMTSKPELERGHAFAQLFDAGPGGVLRVRRLNIPLTADAP